MHLPLWFDVTDYVFHTVIDVLYLVFTCLALAVIAKTRRREHLTWLIPSVIASVLTLVYRLIKDAHFFGGFGTRQFIFTVTYSLFYVANIIGVYACLQLWRTMKIIASSPRLHAEESEASQPGVWPPPPIRTHEQIL